MQEVQVWLTIGWKILREQPNKQLKFQVNGAPLNILKDVEDMILNEEQEKFYHGSSGRNVRKEEKWRWPKAEVVYEIDPVFCKDLSCSQL